ncbi:MAG: tRNA pseudouridine(55) synthase TruB [Lewinellaceae bacterium]|nr:tRNA pseudouridine(55) synthase TruB [Lewinellaceae bacterium]
MQLITRNQPFPEPFPEGAVILIDKPPAWTSFDVVNKVRYHLSRRLGVKRVKIGHAGTLDPLATGLLVLCTGQYTRKIEAFQAMPKEYEGVITFGATTPSFDLEKAVDATFPTEHLDIATVRAAAQQFTGEIQQIPPVFSAVKVDGKRLYKNARTGEDVELPERTVHIDLFELDHLRPVGEVAAAPVLASAKGAPIMLHPDYAEGMQIDFRVVCSKGTYIRSLANDLGRAVGSGAYLSSLRRTRTGGFSIDDAWQIDEIVSWITGASLP